MSGDYLYCPKCGCEYHAWASTCVDCGVALVAQPPAVSEVVEKRRVVDDSNADHSLSVVAVGDLSADERDRLTFLTRAAATCRIGSTTRLWSFRQRAPRRPRNFSDGS